jgi:hypothetical protein
MDLKRHLFLLFILISQFNFSQDLTPYNEDFEFEVMDDDEVIPKNDSLHALIIDAGNSVKNIEISLKNNPQLREVKLMTSSQEVLDVFGRVKFDSLFFLLIENYTGSTLNLPMIKSLEFLQIHATELKSFDISKSLLSHLEILEMDAPHLVSWKSETTYPVLSLIDLDAPLLTVFPILSMPKINEFSYSCSFKELPKNFCTYKELEMISFENFCPVKVDKCLVAMVEKGEYSNLTVYDKKDGNILVDINSKDK